MVSYNHFKTTKQLAPKRVLFHGSDSENDQLSDSASQNDSKNTFGSEEKSKNQKTERQRKEKAELLAKAQQQLPVFTAKEAIIEEIWKNDTVVVLGETGCGKTTQIPQYLIGPEYKNLSDSSRPIKVVVTQPRRVAATALAARVAEEVGCLLGTKVGYSVRFDDCSQKQTRLKYVTDGTLLQEMLSDKLLTNYDIVIIDEAHERSLRTDMLLGFLKSIQKTRNDMVNAMLNFPKDPGCSQAATPARPLKVIVMSATIDAERFSQFFNNAKVIYIKGRQHTVTVFYTLQPQDDYIESAIKTSLQIHSAYPPGDVLVFLTGQDEIENMQAQLQMYADDAPLSLPQMMICPLYAKLPSHQQQKAFQKTPPNVRKFVLATNVAETSITIPGVNYVIDTGLAKVKRFHGMAGIEELRTEPISQSSANQRLGRAGRESTGMCWRLYPRETYNTLSKTAEPEIKRCSLSFAILHLLATGVPDIFNFDFMDKPQVNDLKFALVHLALLGAIDSRSKINDLGRRIAALPLDPPLGRCLLASFDNKCPSEMIDLIALLEHSDTLLINTIATREQAQEARRKFIHRDGDHLILLNILKAYRSIADNFKAPAALRVEQKKWCKEHFINFKSINNVLESKKQLQDRCKRLGLNWIESSSLQISQPNASLSIEDDSAPLLNSLIAGLATQLAIRQPDQTYINPLTKVPLKIHPSSSLYGKGIEAFLYHELVRTSSTYARMCSVIKPIWIQHQTNIFSAT